MIRITIVIFIFCLAIGTMSCNNSTDDPPTDLEKKSAVTSGPAFKNIRAAEFQEKMKNENTVVLDVRTPAEIEEGMIDGALTIDITDPEFQEKIKALDENKTYLVYCKAGGRSSRACEIMAELGFDSLYNLEEGYMNWPE